MKKLNKTEFINLLKEAYEKGNYDDEEYYLFPDLEEEDEINEVYDLYLKSKSGQPISTGKHWANILRFYYNNNGYGDKLIEIYVECPLDNYCYSSWTFPENEEPKEEPKEELKEEPKEEPATSESINRLLNKFK